MAPEGKRGQWSKEKKKNQGGEKKQATNLNGLEEAGELRNTENGMSGKVGKVSECQTWL